MVTNVVSRQYDKIETKSSLIYVFFIQILFTTTKKVNALCLIFLHYNKQNN